MTLARMKIQHNGLKVRALQCDEVIVVLLGTPLI